ncbi:hypothetical protein CGLO_05104 [Colletotrichum gloeosporioides Cg-14]|uniref:Uncharacterized protein n=1 Tax=Colletotrichum gloeosporioides (strain Cg-14) TaxID=1237896 RepID=T0KQU1_COLGC|nr:hypothetical protein CGLO_05104 [Colletotrichum gloeosporioides Cg-14]
MRTTPGPQLRVC